MKRQFRAAALVGALLLVNHSPLNSQELGTHLVRTSSDHVELANPGGFGGYAAVPLFEWLNLRLAYDRVSNDSKGTGEVCTHYAPNWGCRSEEVETSTSLGNLSLALLPTLRLNDWIKVGLGGGIGLTQIHTESLGVSGREANFEAPKTGQFGYSAMLSLGVTPLPNLPLSLVGSAATHWVGFKSCISYEEIYDPFCGTTLFRELTVGLAFGF